MKSTGIIRKIDPIGKVTLPIELRKNLDLKPGDPVEIFVDGHFILLKKYTTTCTLCGNDKDIYHINGICFCKKCINKIKAINIPE